MNKTFQNEFLEFLKLRNYSARTIELYLDSVKSIDIKDNYSVEEFYSFSVSYLIEMANKGMKKSLLNNLSASLHQVFLMKYGISFRSYEKEKIKNTEKGHLEILLDDFFLYSTTFKTQNITTAKAEKTHIKTFLMHIGYDSGFDFNKISAIDIAKYVISEFKSLKNSSKGRYITSLRNFFRYLDYKGISYNKEILELPLTVADWKGGMLPVVLNKDEQNKIRNHFYKNNEKSIRNYLITAFMMDLGLRCAEITNIMVKDIQWSSMTLIIRKTKTRVERSIPLSKELLNYLEEYLTKYRSINSAFLFTTINPRSARDNMIVEEVRRIVRQTYKEENISGYWKGTHALRRTAASNIFNSSNSIKVVGDILGHESLDSTKNYVKVDFDLLRSIASLWPEGVSNE